MVGFLTIRRPDRETWVVLQPLALLVCASVGLLALELSELPVGRRAFISALILLILLPAVMLGQYAPPPYRLPYAARLVLLCVQITLTYGPILVLRLPWLSLLGFLAGAVLLTIPRPASLLIAAAVCASGPLLVVGLEYDHRSGTAVLLSTLITGASIFGITQLALLAARLRAAQAHAARSAIQEERARLTRDLHDVVGSTLAQIAGRAEAATSADALPGIALLARQTLAELRDVSRDRAELDLRTELQRAGQTLAAVGVTVRSEITLVALPPRQRPLPRGRPAGGGRQRAAPQRGEDLCHRADHHGRCGPPLGDQ